MRKCNNRAGRCAAEGEHAGGFGQEQRAGTGPAAGGSLGLWDSEGDREQLLCVLPRGSCLQKLYLPP